MEVILIIIGTILVLAFIGYWRDQYKEEQLEINRIKSLMAFEQLNRCNSLYDNSDIIDI